MHCLYLSSLPFYLQTAFYSAILNSYYNNHILSTHTVGSSGLVLARGQRIEPAQQTVSFSQKSLIWAWAAHLLQCLGQLSLPPFEGW